MYRTQITQYIVTCGDDSIILRIYIFNFHFIEAHVKVCHDVCVSVCPCSHGRNFEPISTKCGTDVRNLKRKNLSLGVKIRYRYPLFLPNFTPSWHPHNAFSMGDLKCFSDIIYGPIIAVHSSNKIHVQTNTASVQCLSNAWFPPFRCRSAVAVSPFSSTVAV